MKDYRYINAPIELYQHFVDCPDSVMYALVGSYMYLGTECDWPRGGVRVSVTGNFVMWLNNQYARMTTEERQVIMARLALRTIGGNGKRNITNCRHFLARCAGFGTWAQFYEQAEAEHSPWAFVKDYTPEQEQQFAARLLKDVPMINIGWYENNKFWFEWVMTFPKVNNNKKH